MHGTKFQQLFQSRGQITITHSSEVIKREEVKVLCQVTWQAVELVQHPMRHTHTPKGDATLCAQRFSIITKLRNKHLLFSQATGLEEIFHVKQLHPQNLNNNDMEKTSSCNLNIHTQALLVGIN